MGNIIAQMDSNNNVVPVSAPKTIEEIEKRNAVSFYCTLAKSIG